MSLRRIMIVEDDADIRNALAAAMREDGADVVVAEDGLDALDRLEQGPNPAVILLDLRLPRLAGEELLRKMRADARFEHIPVITMTAGATGVDGQEVVAHLHKPVDIEDLRKIVLSLFEAAA